MGYYVGIDIGTSSTKIVMVNEDGEILKESSKNYSVSQPHPGWKEIDPEIWMNAVDECIMDLLLDQDAKKIKAIGVTGQMHTVVFIGSDGKSIRPALMWNDIRTSNRLAEVKSTIRENPVISHIANIISTGSPAMNLLWLKENEPENFREMRKFLIGPDYIVYRLTGFCQTDYCEASTSSLFNLKNGEWSPEMRQILGLPERIFPQVRGTNEVVGEVLEYWKERYGLSDGVKVLVGTGDNPASAISTGCFAGKYPVLSLGTSGVLMFPKEQMDFSAKGKNIMFSFDGKEISILVQGAVQSCGSSFGWWMSSILKSSDYEEETAVDPESLGNGELIFYPHLVGDKTIYADASLRGAFFGIGTDVTRKDMTIAVMEGICFAVKQLSEEMKVPIQNMEHLKVIGGGSKNAVWMQILANVLNIPICQTESGAGAGYGVALTAAGTIGNASLDEIVKRIVKVKKVFEPCEYNVKLYEEKYHRYLKIHDAIKMIAE